MGKFEIVRTDTADSLLHRIVLGVAENFGANVALRKLEDIEKGIKELEANPMLGIEPKYMVLKRQGYRVLIMEKDLVFYKVNCDRKEVVIYAIVDQRQDYLSILRGL